MDWFAQIDDYCERTDLAYWSEPLNALSNLAFLIVALVLWQRSAAVPMARALSAILLTIGMGSFLFHTNATIWASAADVVPIGIFILVYLFAVHRDVVPMGHWFAVFATALFIPYAAILVPILSQFPFIRISAFYWSVPILLGIYALILRRKPAFAQGFVIGAGLLSLSIIIRSLDEILCDAIPIGTHFMWHVLNGIMLGWMIHVYTRHMLAAAPTER